MDEPAALLRDLVQLGAVDGNDNELDQLLSAVVTALRAAVPSYRGIALTLVQHDHPVQLTAFRPPEDGESISTSLRLRLAVLVPSAHRESRVVFYAAVPGAFVDLTADLGYLLDGRDQAGRPTEPATGADGRSDHSGADGWGAIVLDADLPPPTVESRITGLQELTAINRALGLLVAEGHHPDQVHAVLRRRAASAGVETHVYAARLLRR